MIVDHYGRGGQRIDAIICYVHPLGKDGCLKGVRQRVRLLDSGIDGIVSVDTDKGSKNLLLRDLGIAGWVHKDRWAIQGGTDALPSRDNTGTT